MVAATAEFLQHELSGYARAWENDRASALAVWDLEARLRTALTLFEHVRRLDEQMTADIVAAGTTWTHESAGKLLSFYREWEGPTSQVARRIAELQAQGHHVAGADEFRAATLRARSTLNISLEKLERSVREADEGKLRPLGEIRDELRRRADADR
jgi:hypothetical protein